MGQSVVLDPTWSHPRSGRRRADWPRPCSADLVELRCGLPAAAKDRQVLAREAMAHGLSDANVDVAASLRNTFTDRPSATGISTDESPAACVTAAVSLVQWQHCALIRSLPATTADDRSDTLTRWLS